VLVSTIVGCHNAPQLERFEFQCPAMGTSLRLVFYAAAPEAAHRLAQEVFGNAERLAGVLTDYDSSSELRLLTVAQPAGTSTPVSSPLWEVLSYAQALAADTGGAFDLTVGPLTRLWRRARRRQELPATELLEAARRQTGWQFLSLDPGRQAVRCRVAGMRLDAGGLAKGYIADRCLQHLQAAGIRSAVVDAGGDLAIGEPPPDEPGWRIAWSDLDRSGIATGGALLDRCGIATSGDHYQALDWKEERLSHIIDPRSGWPLRRPIAATVRAPSAMEADALASAACVLGPQQGLALLQSRDQVEGRLVWQQEDGQTKVLDSSGFAMIEFLPNLQRGPEENPNP
jgi:thiamine biosynthesis lipoprotein